jgi:hypothetical protein
VKNEKIPPKENWIGQSEIRSTKYGILGNVECWTPIEESRRDKCTLYIHTIDRGPLTAICNKFLNNFQLLGILYQKNAHEKN